MHTRRQQAIGCGCSFLTFAALTALGLSLLGAWGPVVLGIAVLLVIVAVASYRIQRWRLAEEFRRTYSASGKDLLIVYSDSPHWGEYIESGWVPRWGERAVMFNRSRPWNGSQIEARLWHSVAGSAEHTPAAIVVPRRGRPRIVRFWRAFRARKHGDDAALREAEASLEKMLSER